MEHLGEGPLFKGAPLPSPKPPPLTLLNFSTDGEAATGVHNRSKKTEKDTGKGKERDSPAFLKTAIASDYKKTISSRAK